MPFWVAVTAASFSRSLQQRLPRNNTIVDLMNWSWLRNFALDDRCFNLWINQSILRKTFSFHAAPKRQRYAQMFCSHSSVVPPSLHQIWIWIKWRAISFFSFKLIDIAVRTIPARWKNNEQLQRITEQFRLEENSGGHLIQHARASCPRTLSTWLLDPTNTLGNLCQCSITSTAQKCCPVLWFNSAGG